VRTAVEVEVARSGMQGCASVDVGDKQVLTDEDEAGQSSVRQGGGEARDGVARARSEGRCVRSSWRRRPAA
jgi:hypothetical protein